MTQPDNKGQATKLPTPRQMVWMYSLLFLGGLVEFFTHRLRPLNKVFIRVMRGYYRWRLWMKPDSVGLLRELAFAQVMVLYDEKAPWPEYLRYLEQLDLKWRVNFAEYLFYLFWINERFDEAKNACDYWTKSAYSWIEEHPIEAKQTLNLLRKTPQWKLGYIKPSTASLEASFPIRAEANKLGAFQVIDYRNARLAGLVLDWLKENDYEPACRYLQNHKINRNPPFPPYYYFSSDFGYEVMQELGMDDQTFLNLCRKAEQFEITSKQTAREAESAPSKESTK